MEFRKIQKGVWRLRIANHDVQIVNKGERTYMKQITYAQPCCTLHSIILQGRTNIYEADQICTALLLFIFNYSTLLMLCKLLGRVGSMHSKGTRLCWVP